MTKWEPFSDIDRFFEDFSLVPFPRTNFDLAVDLFERGNDLVARMNLPGVKPSDVSITIENNVLSIEGSRKEETETSEKNYYSKEIRTGSFSRSVRLPKMVDESKIDAVYADGVLEVQMPVVASHPENKIQIKVKGSEQLQGG